MKRIVYIISLLVVATAYSSQIQRQVPATLLGQAERLSRRLHNATALDAATRTEATRLLGTLVNYAGTENYVASINADMQRLAAVPVEEKTVACEAMEDVTSSSIAPAVEPALPATITIHAGRIGGAKQEALDTQATEAISGETYAELIAQQQEHGDPFILARIITRDDRGNEYVHYYDAHRFNQWRFGNYPLNRTLNIVKTTNPQNRQILENSVQYFMYDPNHQQRGFTLMFTEEELFRGSRSKFLRAWLDANQNFDPSLKASAQLYLGAMYSNGKGIPQDYTKARQYYEQAAQQTLNQDARAAAQGNLGNMYYNGRGVPQDYVKARQYYEQAAQQTVDPDVRAVAQVNLGNVYYNGRGVPQDYVKARQYYEQAAQQAANPAARARAQFNLGNVYYYGRGVLQDYTKARQYYEQAAQQTLDPAAAALAQQTLAEIAQEEKKTQATIGEKHTLAGEGPTAKRQR